MVSRRRAHRPATGGGHENTAVPEGRQVRYGSRSDSHGASAPRCGEKRGKKRKASGDGPVFQCEVASPTLNSSNTDRRFFHAFVRTTKSMPHRDQACRPPAAYRLTLPSRTAPAASCAPELASKRSSACLAAAAPASAIRANGRIRRGRTGLPAARRAHRAGTDGTSAA